MLLNTLAALVALCAFYAKADVIPVKCSMASLPVPVPANLPALPCVLPTPPLDVPPLGTVNIQKSACPVTQLDCGYECPDSKLHACVNPAGVPAV